MNATCLPGLFINGPARPIVAPMQEFAALLARIDSLTARTAQSSGEAPLREIEHLLSEGYAEALAGEARLVRLEHALEELLDGGDESRARELRELVRDYRQLERAVAALRSALAAMHGEFVALGGARVHAR